jgi:chitodextrinase
MARLLTDTDYLKVTLSDTVRDLIDSNYNQWLDAEQAAQLEMASYLNQRYIVSSIFTDTTIYDSLRTYSAKALVQYTESEYNDLTAYTVGNRVSFEGYIYECYLAAQGISPDNTDYWVKRVLDYSLYYVTLPGDEWDKDTTYLAGDVVWYKNKQYTATVSCKNIEPSASTSVNIWGSGTTYTIAANLTPDIEYHDEITYAQFNIVTYMGNKYTYKNIAPTAGNLPTDTNYWDLETTAYEWTKGDNRNALLVRFLLDITAYHFMRSVPARAIPDHIKQAYNGDSADDRGGALGWLKNVAKGFVSADLPEIYSTPLYSIMHGQSRDKQDNLLW